MNIIEQLKKYDINTPLFSLDGIETFGKIVDIYDGDTMKIILPVESSFYKFNLRLNGIDTCEIKSKNEENKNKGLEARNKILSLIDIVYKCDSQTNNIFLNSIISKTDIKNYLQSIDCIVKIKCYQFDKYGRLLGDIYIDYNDPNCQSLSDILIQSNLAYSYDGGKKLAELDQL